MVVLMYKNPNFYGVHLILMGLLYRSTVLRYRSYIIYSMYTLYKL